MGGVDPASGGGRRPQRRLREVAAFFVGVACTESLNLVAANVRAGLELTLAALAVACVFGATYAVGHLEPTSLLRTRLPPVLLVAAVPFILLSVLGAWRGYLMFVAAILVAIGVFSRSEIAVSSRREGAQVAVVWTAGMAMIAAGPVTFAGGLHDFTRDLQTNAIIVVVGPAEIAAGCAVLKWGRRMLQHMDEDTAEQFLILGLIGTIAGLGWAGSAIQSPDIVAIVLPTMGLTLAFIGCALTVLVTQERIDDAKAVWHEWTCPRDPQEHNHNPSFSQSVLRFLQRYGTVSTPSSLRGDPDESDNPNDPDLGSTGHS